MSSKKARTAGSSASKSSSSQGRAKTGSSSSSSSSNIPTTTSAAAKITQLEKQLLETASSSAGGDLNGIVDLIELLQTSLGVGSKGKKAGTSSSSQQQVKTSIAAAQALHNVFVTLLRQGRLIGKVKDLKEDTPAGQALTAVREWTKARWAEYLEVLCEMLCHEDTAVAIASLTMLMNLLKLTSEHLSSLSNPPAYNLNNSLWRLIAQALVVPQKEGATVNASMQAEFSAKYLNFYDDIRYYFLKNVSSLTDTYKGSEVYRNNMLYFLESLTAMATAEEQLDQFWAGMPKNRAVRPNKLKPHKGGKTKKRKRPGNDDGSTGIFDDSDDTDSGDEEYARQREANMTTSSGLHDLLNLKAHRKVFTSAWTSFLSLDLSEEDIKRVLVMLHRQVMPHLVDPSVLIDFLADCTDYGGTVALLALNGLFTLISKHGLDYPDFFLNLYRLLDNQVLHVRYRPRFLRMLATFLSSTRLPIALVATFIKRLARLSLHAPPAAIVAIIPFVYNLLKRHPACMVLIHSAEQIEPGAEYRDPYDDQEVDPLKTGAIDSSLWEIATMRSHYAPSVSTLAKIFEEAFTKPNYDMDDFLDHTYSTMFETETQRKVKKAPALNGVPPASEIKFLFPTPIDPAAPDAEEAALLMEGKGDIISKLWSFS